mmetsp:Transcript_32855/g.101798  ORF Transcript_32855/g.101798 Transcript_32855/m.101798 type:complete len:319 (+) Transcript_32855:436-1392(+)
MASRDLTRRFVEWRASRGGGATRPTKRASSEDRGLVGGYSTDGSEGDGLPSRPADAPSLPPVWVDVVEKVEGDVLEIERSLRDLKDLHTRRLMVSFDDGEEARLDRAIEGKTRDATKLFRACEQTLKRVATMSADGKEPDDSERKIRANVQRSVAVKIQGLNTDFRRAQKEYLAKLKSQKDGAGGGFDFLSGGGDRPPDAGDTEFTDQQLSAVVDVEQLVEERDAEIRKIAESIQELSSIFKELAVLVIDQGTILDRIDFNMEQVAEHTRKGVVEIEKAEQYQKAARPRICIALLLFLITIMMIALVLKHQGNDKKKK